MGALVTGLALQAIFIGLVIAAAVVDLRALRIPNVLVAGMVAAWVARMAAALAFALDSNGGAAAFPDGFATLGTGDWSAILLDSVAGAAVLGGTTLVAALVMEKLSGRPSFGGGDIKMLFAVGLWLGVSRGLACLLVACLAALALAFALPRLGWRPPSDTTAAPEAEASAETASSAAPATAAPAAAAPAAAVPTTATAETQASSNPEESTRDQRFLSASVPFAPAIAVGVLVTLALP